MSDTIFADCPEGLPELFSGIRIGIAGVGGIGSNTAMLLTRAGAVSLVIADFDRVETGNLNRQFFFSDQTGQLKVDALSFNLKRINSDISVEKHSVQLTPKNIVDVFGECDVLIEAVDAPKTKAFIIEEWSASFPERRIIACSGVSGVSPVSEILVKRSGSLSVVGDHSSSTKSGTFSAKVLAVASAMVSELYDCLTAEKCSGCSGCSPGGVSLWCNNQRVPLIGFPARMIENVVRGMVSSLKGADSSGSIKIEM